jgi:hypothetical protein
VYVSGFWNQLKSMMRDVPASTFTHNHQAEPFYLLLQLHSQSISEITSSNTNVILQGLVQYANLEKEEECTPHDCAHEGLSSCH